MRGLHRENGFTLVELLVATAVAAIFTGMALNVHGMLQRGIVGSSDGYVRYVADRAKELRCRSRFARGLPPCDAVPCEDSFCGSRMNVRKRF